MEIKNSWLGLGKESPCVLTIARCQGPPAPGTGRRKAGWCAGREGGSGEEGRLELLPSSIRSLHPLSCQAALQNHVLRYEFETAGDAARAL